MANTVVAPTATPTPLPTELPILPLLTPYTVRSGDNPTVIAENAGVADEEQEAWIGELLSLNGVDAHSLQIGQTLILPPLADGSLPTVRNDAPSAGGGQSAEAGAGLPGVPPDVVIAQPISTAPASTATPAVFAGGGIPFAPTPPFVAFTSPTASPAGTTAPTGTPAPSATADFHIWLTSSEETATNYYCDVDSGWHSIPPEKLQTFASEQDLLAIWGGSRTKAPNSVC